MNVGMMACYDQAKGTMMQVEASAPTCQRPRIGALEYAHAKT